MDIKYKGDHTVCGLLCLAPFTSQLVPFLLYSWEMEFIVSCSGFYFPSPISSISSVKCVCAPPFFAAWFTFSAFSAVRHKPLSSQLAVRGCPPKGIHFKGEVSCRILAVAILAPSYNPRRVPVRGSAKWAEPHFSTLFYRQALNGPSLLNKVKTHRSWWQHRT